jgi:phosphate transport system substrate-binding protein
MKAIYLGLAAMALYSCKNEQNEQQTILTGKTAVYVDEAFFPVVEDQVVIFESLYDAKISLVPKSEEQVVTALANDSVQIAILSRKLNDQERAVFTARKISPKTTHFAKDAVVFLSHKDNKDTVISLSQVKDFLSGGTSLSGLVFDSPNSSALRQLASVSGVKEVSNANIYSFNKTSEAIKYISENRGMIGVVSMNWLTQPDAESLSAVNQIRILPVAKDQTSKGVYPSQDALAQGIYPVARDLYLINCQGFSGLGMGFASFIAGDKGQRIVLKSGLLPVRMPGRNITIRNSIETKVEKK